MFLKHFKINKKEKILLFHTSLNSRIIIIIIILVCLSKYKK